MLRSLLGEEKKSSRLGQRKQVRVMSRNCCHHECICLITRRSLRVFPWRQQSHNATTLTQIFPKGLRTPTLRQWNFLQLEAALTLVIPIIFPLAQFVSCLPSHLSLARELRVMRTTIEGLWVSTLDGTVSMRSALTQHAPDSYGNYLPQSEHAWAMLRASQESLLGTGCWKPVYLFFLNIYHQSLYRES